MQMNCAPCSGLDAPYRSAVLPHGKLIGRRLEVICFQTYLCVRACVRAGRPAPGVVRAYGNWHITKCSGFWHRWTKYRRACWRGHSLYLYSCVSGSNLGQVSGSSVWCVCASSQATARTVGWSRPRPPPSSHSIRHFVTYRTGASLNNLWTHLSNCHYRRY